MLKDYYEKHYRMIFYPAAFLLPLFGMLFYFAVRHIYPFGDITFLRKDMYQQYTPFFYEFYRKVKNGDTLWYSWNAGLGANFLAVIAYYLASPLNFLCTLFPEENILEFMTYSIVIKTALMGLTASSYLAYHFKRHDPAMVFFGFAYSMSAFMAAYSWNIEWMDVLFITPLVILGLEKLVNKESSLCYCLALSYAIFTNYYLSIMLCIYVFLYFIVLNIVKGFDLKVMIRFCVFSLLSGLNAAVLILPEYYALRFTTFTNIRFPSELKVYMNPLELFTSHMIGVTPETGLGHYPNIYCGLLTVFLVMVYAFYSDESLKEKICYLFLVLFFLLSFDLNTLNFIWHGLNFPDSLPARQGYLYILLLMTIAYKGFLIIREEKQNLFYAAIILSYILVIVTAFFSDKDRMDDIAKILTYVFSLVIMVLFLFYRSAPAKIHFPGNGQETFFRYALLILFASEILFNMYFTNGRSVKRIDYFKKYESFVPLNEDKKAQDREDDSPLARADEVGRSIRNHSMMVDYPSLSFFSSTTNGLLIKYLNKYGIMNSRVFYLADGTTAVTSLLSGQKYIFVPEGKICNSEDIASAYKFAGGAALYEYKDHLPNGYVIRCNDQTERKLFIPSHDAEKIIDGELYPPNGGTSPAEAQNNLMHDFNISGTALMSYGSADTGSISKGDTALTVTYTDNCHLYAYDHTKTSGEVKVNVSDGTSLGKVQFNKYRYFLDLGFRAEGTTISFIPEDPSDKDMDIEFFKLNPSVLDSFTSSVNEAERLRNIKIDDDSLKGGIDMKSPGHLILTVPYEPGWTLHVDGRETHIDLFDGLWISTDLPEGQHEIRIDFFPKGLKTGGMISLISLTLMILSLLYEKLLQKRAKHQRA
ncbi:MAG: YfhO family protein [Lachnospiraceae bacterium]|nr:YfhO family protein [Lachnospiraceae bacterium]